MMFSHYVSSFCSGLLLVWCRFSWFQLYSYDSVSGRWSLWCGVSGLAIVFTSQQQSAAVTHMVKTDSNKYSIHYIIKCDTLFPCHLPRIHVFHITTSAPSLSLYWLLIISLWTLCELILWPNVWPLCQRAWLRACVCVTCGHSCDIM